MKKKTLLATIIMLFLLPMAACAYNVTFRWEPYPQGSAATGFKLYMGMASGGNTYIIDIPDTTKTELLIPDFESKYPEDILYCSLTAFDSNTGQESEKSNEAVYQKKMPLSVPQMLEILIKFK